MVSKQTTLDLNGPILSFIQQPVSVTINTNGSAQFVGIATAIFPTQTPPNPSTGTGIISYRWYEVSFGALSNGSNSILGVSISGSETNTLTISNAVKSNLRFYLVADYMPSAYSQPPGSAVTVGTARSTGNATNDPNSSNIATLTVRPLISVTQNPLNASVAVNTRANFSARGVSSDETAVSYRWQLNGSNITDSSNISGSGTPNLSISLPNASNNTVRARISHPTASNSPIFTNSANFTVVQPRAIINIEDFATADRRFFRTTNLLNQPHIALGITNPGTVYTVYAPERDIRVRITLAAGAGESRNGFLGGEGGISVFNYTFEQNVQYVFKMGSLTGPRGGDNNSGGGVTQLYRKARLVAMCGGGGAAGSQGRGGAGGGVNLAGQPGSGRGAGNGGITVSPGTTLNGSLASGTTGGFVSTCMRGDELIRITGIPACNDFPGLTQSRLPDGSIVSNSAFLFRGFKPGNPTGFRNNGGNGTRNEGGGGSGAYGGNAAISDGSGGGGGSGYSNGSISLISSTVGGNSSTIGYIIIENLEANFASCRERYYDYRYGGSKIFCTNEARSRRGQWYQSNDGNWYPVVSQTRGDLREVQNIFVNTLNRPGHIFEIENAVAIYNESGPTGLRNFLLSTETVRSTPPTTRCGRNYFGTNIPAALPYCSGSISNRNILGPEEPAVRPLGSVLQFSLL